MKEVEDLKAAVGPLLTSVAAGIAEIQTEVATIVAAGSNTISDADKASIEDSVGKINGVVGAINTAVSAAQAATAPAPTPDPAAGGDQSAAPAAGDPSAQPSGSASS